MEQIKDYVYVLKLIEMSKIVEGSNNLLTCYFNKNLLFLSLSPSLSIKVDLSSYVYVLYGNM